MMAKNTHVITVLLTVLLSYYHIMNAWKCHLNELNSNVKLGIIESSCIIFFLVGAVIN